MVISDLFPPGPMLQGYRLHTTGLLSRRAPGSSLKTEHWPLFSDLRLNKGFPGGTSVKESETQLRFLGQEDPLEKGMATHSSILTWKIPHGQRSLAGYSPWGHNELEVIKHICTGSISFLTYFQIFKDNDFWTSLVVQWLRIRLPMQGSWVPSLVEEDSTCCRATKPVRCNWAWALELVLCNKRSHCK